MSFVFLNHLCDGEHLNYGVDGYEQGKLDYTARVDLRKTPIFDKLSDIHDRLMSQSDFIDFLTDYAPILESNAAITLIFL